MIPLSRVLTRAATESSVPFSRPSRTATPRGRFLTLRDSSALKPGDLSLLKPETADDDEATEIWRWALARCAVLLHDHGVASIMDVHDLDTEVQAFDVLTDYAREALDRFDSADDTVARVLGGGVAKRWQGRLAVTESDLARALKADDVIAGQPGAGVLARFLDHVAVDARTLQATVASLVDATQEACEVDYDAAGASPDCSREADLYDAWVAAM